MFGIHAYLAVSVLLFSLGIIAVLSRRNMIAVLMGIELILNAAALNFVAFSRFITGSLDGHIFALFIIVIAAAEAAVVLAIILRLYQIRGSIDIDQAADLRD